MISKKMKILLILLAISSLISAINIKCAFKMDLKDYECKVKETNDTSTGIGKISGTHMSGKSNFDVTIFKSTDQTFNFIPDFIGVTFPQLKSLTINSANITKLTSENFKQFGKKITYINLDSNKITRLDRHLFIHNRNLERLDIDNNDIMDVEIGAFFNLIKLQTLYMQSNKCIKKFVSNSKVDVLFMIHEVESKCIGNRSMSDFSLQQLKDLKVENLMLRNEVITNREQNESFEKNENLDLLLLSAIKSSISELKATIDLNSKQINEIMLKMEEDNRKSKTIVGDQNQEQEKCKAMDSQNEEILRVVESLKSKNDHFESDQLKMFDNVKFFLQNIQTESINSFVSLKSSLMTQTNLIKNNLVHCDQSKNFQIKVMDDIKSLQLTIMAAINENLRYT